ncbi:hypothetical protein [Streptomyces sp. NPDC004728]|uniref:hypothetical protein n=1 Tax=Streptomyces sp. NPDC004728 TaxID=3154289 RepID=UPI0033B376DB
MSLSPEARRGGVPDHSEEEVLVELYGPDNDGWYSSRILDWIGLSDGLRDPDTRGYLVLRALVYEKYKKPVRNLTLSLLCELIPGPNGKASSQGRVRGILKALSDVGLISTPDGGPVKTSSRASAAGKPLRIRINDMPQEGYSGWRNVEAKLKWLQAGKPSTGAGQNSDPAPEPGEGETGAGQNSDPGGSNSDPDSGSDLRKREHPLVPSVGASEAPAGRSPVDGRSPSTSGSSRAREEGGFAASGKTSPSPTKHDETRGPARGQESGSKKAAHTREQLDVVRRVRALFPRELLDAEGGLPDVPTLSSAILTAMGEGRTVEQMGERIWYRWSNHGFADQWAELGRFEKPVGVAVALVRPLRRGDRFACPDLRCENGASLDTGALCRLCAERIADWKAEQARKYGPKPSGGANSRAGGTDSPDAPVPPQRAVQPSSEPRSTEDWAAQARVEEAARKKGECDGRDGMCGRLLAPGRSLCGDCEDEAAEQYFLENKGLPAPF